MTARALLVAGCLAGAIGTTAVAASHAQAQQTFTRQPPRDRGPAPRTGTAVVRGRIVADDTGRPLRRARITLSSPELGRDNRTTSTGLDGRYELTALPAGRYTVRVQRNGYLRLQYGQRRSLEQGKRLQLADGEVVADVDFRLPRSSVISGQVTDELGEPVEAVSVYAMRSAFWQGRRRLVPAGSARTDDIGNYRLTGLMPGTYLVMASLREKWTVTVDGESQVMGSYLDSIRHLGQPLSLSEGETRPLALELVNP